MDDLRVGDIQELPHGDGAFDVVTAFNSLQYATDPAAAVRELARVCRPGGTVAGAAWVSRPAPKPKRCSPAPLAGLAARHVGTAGSV